MINYPLHGDPFGGSDCAHGLIRPPAPCCTESPRPSAVPAPGSAVGFLPVWPCLFWVCDVARVSRFSVAAGWRASPATACLWAPFPFRATSYRIARMAHILLSVHLWTDLVAAWTRRHEPAATGFCLHTCSHVGTLRFPSLEGAAVCSSSSGFLRQRRALTFPCFVGVPCGALGSLI